jgi:hypothetical protein
MLEKLKFIAKNLNYGRAALWTAIWVALVTFFIYVFRANDYINHTDSGNIVIYPSYFMCIKLFLKIGSNWIWGIVSLVLSAIAGVVFEAIISTLADANGGTIGAIFVALVFSILVFYLGIDSRNIDEMTHHTVTKAQYDSIPNKNHVDYYFHDAFQADSLYGK